jgi:acyl-CoA thioesterase I
VTANDDRRVCFVGDSFVAGVGDPEQRGWVGRVTARSYRDGHPITGYNLGVRGDTSEDVRRRLPAETAARWVEGCDNRLVVSFGVNDTTAVEGGVRVPPAQSTANLRGIAEQATAWGVALLVVGPPPVADREQNARIAAVDQGLREAAAGSGCPYLGVFDPLLTDPVWMREVHLGDGSHPGAAGYDRLSDLVLPTWRTWIGRP